MEVNTKPARRKDSSRITKVRMVLKIKRNSFWENDVLLFEGFIWGIKIKREPAVYCRSIKLTIGTAICYSNPLLIASAILI
jgi:hypothetical protein